MRSKFKSPFIKYITILTSGSLLAQLITIATVPLITRLYTPEDIGIYMYFVSVAILFMPILNGRYDMSIVTEEKNERILPLIKLSLVIAFCSSVLISTIYGIYLFFSKQYYSYLYTVPLLFLLLLSYGAINVLTSYNNRRKEYKLLTHMIVIRSTFQNVGAIIFGLFKVGVIGLLFSYTAGQIMGINRQAKSLRPYLRDVKKVSTKEMSEVLKLHYKQPLFSVPALFANSLSYSSITFFIEALFGISILGFYSISVRMLVLPISVISGNVSKVFFEEASREYNDTGQFFRALKKTVLFQSALAIPMVIGMMFLAPQIFGFVFGESWGQAGVYVKILAPLFGVRFIVTTITPGLLIAKKQNYELVLQLLFILVTSFSFLLTKLFSLSVEMFLIYICVSNTFIYIIFFFVILRISKKRN